MSYGHWEGMDEMTVTVTVEMPMMQVRITTGPTIRQHCVVCCGETWKHAVQAYAFRRHSDAAVGAVCESCLQDGDTRRLPFLRSVPSYQALERERGADVEEDVF